MNAALSTLHFVNIKCKYCCEQNQNHRVRFLCYMLFFSLHARENILYPYMLQSTKCQVIYLHLYWSLTSMLTIETPKEWIVNHPQTAVTHAMILYIHQHKRNVNLNLEYLASDWTFIDFYRSNLLPTWVTLWHTGFNSKSGKNNGGVYHSKHFLWLFCRPNWLR